MAQFPSEIITLSSMAHWQQLKAENQKILLCFSANWCAPCRAMEATLMNTAFELSGQALVVKADIEQFSELAQAVGVKSIPAYLAVYQGKACFPTFGIQSIDKLVELIEYCDL